MAYTALDRLEEFKGFTLDCVKGEWVTEGFAVSTNPERTRMVEGSVDTLTLATYLRDNLDLLYPDDRAAHKVYGAWLDTESGITYLDVITVVGSEAEALELAREHGEIAIYDLGQGREIRVQEAFDYDSH